MLDEGRTGQRTKKVKKIKFSPRKECDGNGGVDEKDIHQILINNHFKTYHYNPLERELIETPTYNTEENTIYVKDIEWVKNRISNSRKYKVLGKLI